MLEGPDKINHFVKKSELIWIGSQTSEGKIFFLSVLICFKGILNQKFMAVKYRKTLLWNGTKIYWGSNYIPQNVTIS